MAIRAGPIGSMDPTNPASAALYLHHGSTYRELTLRTVHETVALWRSEADRRGAFGVSIADDESKFVRSIELLDDS